MIGISEFLTDPQLLGTHFEGPSWDRWRAVLRAAFSLPMTADELALFQEVAGGRNPPTRPVRELVCAVGRGGGKDSIAAALATWIAVTADTSNLRAGEFATVCTFATDRDQAAICLDYIRGFFEDENLPLLRGMVKTQGRRPSTDSNSIELSNRTRNNGWHEQPAQPAR